MNSVIPDDLSFFLYTKDSRRLPVLSRAGAPRVRQRGGGGKGGEAACIHTTDLRQLEDAKEDAIEEAQG